MGIISHGTNDFHRPGKFEQVFLSNYCYITWVTLLEFLFNWFYRENEIFSESYINEFFTQPAGGAFSGCPSHGSYWGHRGVPSNLQ